MFNYDPLWKTMERKGFTTYTLISKHGINSRTVNNIKHGKGITLYTLGNLCRILDCTPNDVVEFTDEDSFD